MTVSRVSHTFTGIAATGLGRKESNCYSHQDVKIVTRTAAPWLDIV